MADDKEELDFGDVETDVKKLTLDDGDEDDTPKLTELKAQITAQPNNAALHAQLGSAYAVAGQETEALAAYSKAIELDGKKASYYEQKAQVYLTSSDTEQAQPLLRKALELEPNNSQVLYDLGKSCQIDEDHKEALKYFKLAVEKNPNNAQALYEVASYALTDSEVKDHEQRHDTALKLFKQVIALDAKFTQAYYNAASILQNRARNHDDIKEAAKLYGQAVALNRRDGQLQAKLIQCYDYLNDDVEREKARAALHAAYKSGQLNDNYTQLNRYCCGQFDVANKFVMSYDHFKLNDQNKVKFVLVVFNKGEVHEEKTLFRITLTHANSSYQLEAVHPDKIVNLGNFPAEPTYQEVKAKAVAYIQSH